MRFAEIKYRYQPRYHIWLGKHQDWYLKAEPKVVQYERFDVELPLGIGIV